MTFKAATEVEQSLVPRFSQKIYQSLEWIKKENHNLDICYTCKHTLTHI